MKRKGLNTTSPVPLLQSQLTSGTLWPRSSSPRPCPFQRDSCLRFLQLSSELKENVLTICHYHFYITPKWTTPSITFKPHLCDKEKNPALSEVFLEIKVNAPPCF